MISRSVNHFLNNVPRYQLNLILELNIIWKFYVNFVNNRFFCVLFFIHVFLPKPLNCRHYIDFVKNSYSNDNSFKFVHLFNINLKKKYEIICNCVKFVCT